MNKPVVLAVAMIAGSTAAHATEILTFGQNVSGSSPVSGTVSGSTTTIWATDAPVTVTSCLHCPSITGPDVFSMNAMSMGPATSMSPGFVTQEFSGSFSIKNAAGTENILSGTFNDAVFGAGTSLTVSVSNAFDNAHLNLTSDYIPPADLTGKAGMSLSLADVTPNVSIINGTLAPFTGSIAGTFSTSYVPEPATIGLMTLGLGLLGFARRRK